jgi:hypothetical protein
MRLQRRTAQTSAHVSDFWHPSLIIKFRVIPRQQRISWSSVACACILLLVLCVQTTLPVPAAWLPSTLESGLISRGEQICGVVPDVIPPNAAPQHAHLLFPAISVWLKGNGANCALPGTVVCCSPRSGTAPPRSRPATRLGFAPIFGRHHAFRKQHSSPRLLDRLCRARLGRTDQGAYYT